MLLYVVSLVMVLFAEKGIDEVTTTCASAFVGIADYVERGHSADERR